MTTVTNTARAGDKNDTRRTVAIEDVSDEELAQMADQMPAGRYVAEKARRDPASIGEISADIVGALASTDPYAHLSAVLGSAYDQAANGKGKDRHNSRSVSFDRQPILEISRMCGLGYPTGQAQKKTQEAVSMFNRGEADRAEAELLGAINYLAAAVLLIRECKVS